MKSLKRKLIIILLLSIFCTNIINFTENFSFSPCIITANEPGGYDDGSFSLPHETKIPV